ncbi:uncharacterized protein J3R85_001484 [Psidium guajava]|nr:uncharacterized protein J3R85_001484 [Psidium guajava]
MPKCLPKIVKKINNKLNANVAELKRMPKNLSLASEATTAFMQIGGQSQQDTFVGTVHPHLHSSSSSGGKPRWGGVVSAFTQIVCGGKPRGGKASRTHSWRTVHPHLHSSSSLEGKPCAPRRGGGGGGGEEWFSSCGAERWPFSTMAA